MSTTAEKIEKYLATGLCRRWTVYAKQSPAEIAAGDPKRCTGDRIYVNDIAWDKLAGYPNISKKQARSASVGNYYDVLEEAWYTSDIANPYINLYIRQIPSVVAAHKAALAEAS